MDAKLLTSLLCCPECRGEYRNIEQPLRCVHCGSTTRYEAGKPIFTAPPSAITPSIKKERSAERGTAWRRANWNFYLEQAKTLTKGQTLLDVGCGRGDFRTVFQQAEYLGVDVFPYEEVDVVCDLTKVNPFRTSSMDAVILSNVLEHVRHPDALLASLAGLLKPSGRLWVAVPFLIKLHQQPIDIGRYTEFALASMFPDAGLEIERFEAVYGAMSLVRGALLNAGEDSAEGLKRLGVIDRLKWRLASRFGLEVSQKMIESEPVVRAITPSAENNAHPLGYQIVARRRTAA